MIFRIIVKTLFIFFLLFNFFAKANDIASMSNISEAAGSSAQAAADQLASDASNFMPPYAETLRQNIACPEQSVS